MVVQFAADPATTPVRQRQEWRLPSTALSVRTMRHGLRALLDDTGLPDDALHDLLLAACEAAINAIEHAQQPSEPFFDVVFEVSEGQVTIVVRDHGQWRSGPRSPHRGRGLTMMSALAQTSLTARRHGTTVTLQTHPVRARPVAPDHGGGAERSAADPAVP